MPTPTDQNQNNNQNKDNLTAKPNIPPGGLLTPKEEDESTTKKWREIILSVINPRKNRKAAQPATSEATKKTEKFEKPVKKPTLIKKEGSVNVSPPQEFEKPKEEPQKQFKIKKISFIKKILFFLLALIALVIILGFSIYYLNLHGAVINKIIKVVPYPSALIKTPCGWKIVRYSDFNDDLKAISFFFNQKKSQDKNFIIPQQDQTISDVYNKELKNRLMECFVKKRNIKISEEELKTELEKIILQAGDKEALKQIAKELYDWDTETFQQKVLYPYLLEKNLTESINQDLEINAKNKEKAESILKLVLEYPKNFYTIAKEHSEDEETRHRGGDLYWIEKEQLDPELEKVAFSLEKGEISDIIQTNAGYHIIKITDKKTTPEEVEQVRLSHILIKTRDFNDWLEQELRKCKIYKFI